MTPSKPGYRPPWLGYLTAGLGCYALLGGLLTLLGWTLGVYRLTDWDNNGISMKANTALAAATGGAALFILSLRPLAHGIVRSLGAFVALLGGLTLLQHITGWNFGIDTLLFDEAPGARAPLWPRDAWGCPPRPRS